MLPVLSSQLLPIPFIPFFPSPLPFLPPLHFLPPLSYDTLPYLLYLPYPTLLSPLLPSHRLPFPPLVPLSFPTDPIPYHCTPPLTPLPSLPSPPRLCFTLSYSTLSSPPLRYLRCLSRIGKYLSSFAISGYSISTITLLQPCWS